MPKRLSPRERATLLEHAGGDRLVRATDLARLRKLARLGLVSFVPTDCRRPRRSRLRRRGRLFVQTIREQLQLASVNNA